MKFISTTLFIFLICMFGFSQARYYKTQMHCHTTNSDGGYSPQDLAQKYYNAGYEIIMITDHNYLTLESEVDLQGLLVIQAEELTFSRHWNGFFLSEVIMPTEDYTCQEAINDVRAQGGLTQLNHYRTGPFTPISWSATAEDILAFENGPDFLEIWNTGTELTQAHDDKSIWDAVLTAGKRVWGSATDDFHPSVSEALEFNKGWNMIWLDSLCAINVYESLVTGKFYASTGVEISSYEVIDYGTHKLINIESSNADKITFWGPNHQVIYEVEGSSASYVLDSHSYIRIELRESGFLGMGNKYAWTQPVFFEQTSTQAMESNIDDGIFVYPNPTHNYFSIELNHFEGKVANIKVLNNLGEVVYRNENNNEYSRLIQISTESWAAANYFIVFELVDKTSITKKVVVEK
jgi:hypothetical protein